VQRPPGPAAELRDRDTIRIEAAVMPFKDVIGHRRLVELLQRSVRLDLLPPSLIFAGPAGVGKRLTALATAQALNCTSPKISTDLEATDKIMRDACGECPTCSRIARGLHPDVLVIEPGDSGSIKTEQVRDAIERAGYRPFEGKRRVVIIDDADALVLTAQNALLKTLEEPPSSSVFILVSARPDVLLPTVISRCPRLRFRPLGTSDIASGLIERGYSEQDARAIAMSSDGSLGRALDMEADEILEARAVARQVLAFAGANRDPRRRIDGAKTLLTNIGGGKAAADRERLSSYLRAMATLLRDTELISTGGDLGTLANADLRPALDELGQVYQGERGTRAFSAIDQALVAIERNAGVKIVADWLVLQL
jgi:DNA polymerase III subunit delta'